MRNFGILASAVALSACGGGGSNSAQSAGSLAVGGGGSITQTSSFVAPTAAATYSGIGVVQHYEYFTQSNASGQGGQLYAADAGTARDSGISITYDPRDAIFDLTINRPKGLVSSGALRFQDPAHRTNFGGLVQPQASVPNLNAPTDKGIQYLESGSGSGSVLIAGTPSRYAVGADGYASNVNTFFYQKPGTTTKYVTYAGYIHNTLGTSTQTDPVTAATFLRNTYSLDRAAFVYGERTTNSAVPVTGIGTYTGDMVATMVFNSKIDTDPLASTYFQWISGSNTTTINFATKTVSQHLTGTALAPAMDAYTSGTYDIPTGSAFVANATGTVDLAGKGGFSGSFTDASFTGVATVNIAGSSLDGAFFGPNGEEVGGAFRIVGGTPDERIDILGTYTGKK
ncbi:hypothetical protein BH09PSE4_BH09PSE4_04130 [soil metagenome]